MNTAVKKKCDHSEFTNMTTWEMSSFPRS